MAQGFLNSSDENKDPESTGEDYFDELSERSFFQDFPVHGVIGVCWTMHDLVHDFAQFLGEDHFYESYNNEGISGFIEGISGSNKCRNLIHLSLVYDERDVVPNSFHSSIEEAKNVRTVQCRSVGSRRFSHRSFNVGIFFSDLVHHLRYLRVLRLKAMGITHVPEEIDKLVHLRYLDLSRNEDLIELPDSMSGLLNLQTLKLKECSNLFKFPKEIGRMIKLRNYSGCMFPSRMGNVRALTNLRFLKFDRCNKCDELPALGLLPSHEELVIKDLKNLKRIGVEIYGGGQCVTEVAFPKLITLEILENENLELWEFGNGEVQVHEMMPRVRSIKLTFCENLIALPALGLLPSLEELVIYELKNLKRIGVEIYGGGQCLGDVAFPKLKTLEFFYTVNLEVWEFGNGEVQVRQMMPRVTTIKLSGCKKLIALPDLNKLPSLETLKIEFAFKLTSIGCNTISSNGGTSFPELTTLEVSYMDNLEVIVRGADALIEGEQGDTNIDTAIMPRLVDLTLIECPKFPLPRYLPSLRSLYLYEHQGDDYFVVRLGEVVRYKELERLRLNAGIGNSWKLIPEYAKDLRQLEHLDIINSNCVGYYGRGDWSVLSHVPDIQIHFQNIDPLTYSPPQGIHPQPG
ncbi:putative disease resistance RPP13-like protein 1 [Papaver somniferum]|uniref:putative disease resistance RPP13-like protein 1 n=1 Tax=Papaver somniferum TaxID=3469 RepID=UPI000E6FA9CB|nr:putative disease resistance RPP13-like protein 1 [Papaver somniferum]